MTNTPYKFSFNGFSGCNIEAYRDDVFLGDIRAFHVEDKSGQVLLLETDRYASYESLIDGKFDIILTVSNEHWEVQTMSVCGCTIKSKNEEMCMITLENVKWWKEENK